MKKYLLPGLFLLLQTSCLPLHVSTQISACPASGLKDVTFYNGSPATGTVIPSAVVDGKTTWTFPDDGDIQISCHYDDGSARIQKLPGAIHSCTAAKGEAVACKAVI